MLETLVESSGHLVEKAELMRRCWPDAYVEEANLAQTICMLRKVLGDTRRSHQYVETVSRRGYRFTARVVSRTMKIEPSGIESFENGGSEAHHLYKRGRYYWSKYTVEGLQKGIDYFRRAIRVDPQHSLSYAGLADCFYRLSNIYLPPKRAMPKARESVLKALDIDDQLAEAHALLGLIKMFYEHDWPGAESEFQKAIELSPDAVLPHKRYGWALGMIGRFDEGLAEINLALNLEPRSSDLYVGLGLINHLARRYDVAVAQAQMALDSEPEYFPARVLLGIAHFQLSHHAQGLIELERAASYAPVPWTLGYLGYAYGLSGKRRQAAEILKQLRRIAKRVYVSPFSTALVHKGLGHREQALESLLRTCRDRSEMLGFAMGSPELDDLRSDPKFARVLRRTGLAPA